MIETIDYAIHQFLFALEEAEERIQIRVDDEDIVQLSDGLSGDSFGEDGWNSKFSKYRM